MFAHIPPHHRLCLVAFVSRPVLYLSRPPDELPSLILPAFKVLTR